MIIIFCVAEKAMFDIFETWNASNPELSIALNWSLSSNPCTNWSGVLCNTWNQSTGEWNTFDYGDNVSSLRYVTYLIPYA